MKSIERQIAEGLTDVFMFVYMSALVPAGVFALVFRRGIGYFALTVCCFGLLYMAVSYVSVVRSRGYGKSFAGSIVYIMVLLIGLLVDSALLRE